MSVQRYRLNNPDVVELQRLVEAGLTISSLSGFYEVDVTLVDDALLPDLDEVMADLGFSFVATSPTDPRSSGVSTIQDFSGSTTPPVSAIGEARIYFDQTSLRLFISENGAPFRLMASSSLGQYACPVGVAALEAVYLLAADTVDQADSDDNTKQPVVGIVQSKPTATSCLVQQYGELPGFVGLTSGATYYLSTTPGQITDTAPIVPGNIVQRVGFAKNTTTLVVMIDRDFETL